MNLWRKKRGAPFRGHLNNGKVAFVFGRAAEHFLYEKPAGHSHLIQIPLLLFADLNRKVEIMAVVYPASSKMAFTSSIVLVLPLVPVTPSTKIFRPGKRYKRALPRPENNDRPAEKTGKVF